MSVIDLSRLAFRKNDADDIAEIFKHKLEMLQTYADEVQHYARELSRRRIDCRDELKSASENLSACALLAQILWREHGGNNG